MVSPWDTPLLVIYINKAEAFPYILNFTANGLFPPKTLCNFPTPLSTAATWSFFSLLLISLFQLYFIPPFSSFLPLFCPFTGQHFDFTDYKSPFFPATLLQTTNNNACSFGKSPFQSQFTSMWETVAELVCFNFCKTNHYFKPIILTQRNCTRNKSQDDFENAQSIEKGCRQKKNIYRYI